MTLEEAIKHAEEMAKCGGECGEDHAQLAEWLKELQERRAAEPEKHTEERTETYACDSISRQAAIEAITGLPTWWADEGGYYGGAQPPMEALLDPKDAVSAIENLPSAQPTLYGYNIEHLKLIATVLQEEDLPPERVSEALTDTGRIVAIVMNEFEKALRKAVEQCTT